MHAFRTEELKGRPRGSREFAVFSIKSDRQIKLYCRASLLRCLELEFNPLVSEMQVNQMVLNVGDARVSIAIQYEAYQILHLVFSHQEIHEGLIAEINKYSAPIDVQCEFLNRQCDEKQKVKLDNLLRLMSYIVKHRDKLSEYNLDIAATLLRRHAKNIATANLALIGRFPECSGALLFELVRQGTINIPNLDSVSVSGLSPISFVGGGS